MSTLEVDMPRDAYEKVYELAADQLGYFTTAQAREAGLTAMAVVMMEKRRVIERLSRGLYRLLHYPISPLAQYMEASLWPYGATGIVSHESALALYGLSDVSPIKVHITLPTTFRVRREIPGHLAVHHADLSRGDWQLHEGIPVTTPGRSIRDCSAVALGGALIGQAVEDGYREGLLSAREADRLRQELLPAQR